MQINFERIDTMLIQTVGQRLTKFGSRVLLIKFTFRYLEIFDDFAKEFSSDELHYIFSYDDKNT